MIFISSFFVGHGWYIHTSPKLNMLFGELFWYHHYILCSMYMKYKSPKKFWISFIYHTFNIIRNLCLILQAVVVALLILVIFYLLKQKRKAKAQNVSSYIEILFSIFLFLVINISSTLFISRILERGGRERERIRFFFHFKVTESSKVFQRQVCISYVQNIHLKNSRYPFTTNMYLIRMLLKVDVYRYNNCY